MLQYDLIIIGGGASGLSAGVSALENGVKKVLILERDSDLGGNLNLFIHGGFGEYYLGEEVTGPELGSKLINDFKEAGGEYKVDTEVLEVTENKIITYVNPEEGVKDIKGSSVIMASGCRERFTGNINIPIHKYIGIYSLVSAHKLINLQGYLPGKEVVILGKNNWSLILARRLLIEGAKVNAIVDITNRGFLDERGKEVIKGFDINVINNARVVDINGDDRIESIDIEDITTLKIETLKCDSLVLTVDYFPEISYIRKSKIGIMNNASLLVNDNYETTVRGIFVCGTVLTWDLDIFNSGEVGYIVGKKAAEYIKNYVY